MTVKSTDIRKNPPKDLSHHFGNISKRRESSKFKQFYKYFSIPGIANVAGGLPNYKYFPFDTLEGKIATPERTFESRNPESQGSKVVVPKFNPPQLDLSTALQYGSGQGFPVLYEWLKEFATKHMHPGVPYLGGFDILPTCGNTDGWNKVLETFTNESTKDGGVYGYSSCSNQILVEPFCYTSATASALARGAELVVVEADNDGFLPDALENKLRYGLGTQKRPRLMYTVSIGQNPTGGIISQERRKQIYRICQKHDIIIVEDEPYWFLQYQDDVKSPWSSGYKFLDSLTQSYLNIDVDGRVVRLDTFSKNVAPGCRLGWITAQPKIIERILRLTESSTQQPSGFVQAMVYKTLAEWGYDGWVKWLESLRDAYSARQKNMCDELEKYSHVVSEADDSNWSHVRTTKVFSFDRPKGGMFVWVRINFEIHSMSSCFTFDQLSSAFWVWLTREPNLVLAAPGSMFSPIPTRDSVFYFRLCFAALPSEEIIPVSQRFGQATQKFWEIRDKNLIRSLIPNPEELKTMVEAYKSVVLGEFGC